MNQGSPWVSGVRWCRQCRTVYETIPGLKGYAINFIQTADLDAPPVDVVWMHAPLYHVATEGNLPDGEQVENAETGPGEEPGRWVTVSEAAPVAGCNKGIITRAVDVGELKSNGHTDRQRRVDAIDLVRWLTARAGKADPMETDKAVEGKVKKYVQD